MTSTTLPAITPDVIERLRQSERVLVTGHLRADGDCLGTAIVLARCLRDAGKQVEIVMPDPPDPRYGFLFEKTPWSIYAPDSELPPYDLAIVTDCNDFRRLGAMGPLVEFASAPRLLVDHHPLGDPAGQWDYRVHDVAAAASGLLAVRLARALDLQLDRAACEAAFVALMTDTGWLKYSNASPEAFAVAAALVEGGVRPAQLFQNLYQRNDPATPAGLAAALGSAEYLCEQRAVVAGVSDAELAAAGGILVESDDLMDILRSVGRVEAVAFLSERQGAVKVSWRSKEWLDVNALAKACGGGGHARAAGATFPPEVDLQQARERVKQLLREAFQDAPRA